MEVLTGCYQCNLDDPIDGDVLHDGHLLCTECAKQCGPDCVEVRL